jgi:hypothetical protein
MRNDECNLAFEHFLAGADIQVSKVIETQGGDQIRAVVTTGDSVMLTAVGQLNGNVVIVVGESGKVPCDQAVFSETWDKIQKAAKAIGKEIFGDGGGGDKPPCTVTTHIEMGSDGKIKSITMTTTCP